MNLKLVETNYYYVFKKRNSQMKNHLDKKIKIFANSRAITKYYHLNYFFESQAMYPLDSNNFSILQPVFSEVCTIINHDEYVSNKFFLTLFA